MESKKINQDNHQEEEPNTTTKNLNKTVYGIDYFYKKYQYRYPTSYFGDGKGLILKKKISKKLYKKILLEYLDIYFKEVYFKEDKVYFLYTGMFRLVLYSPRIIKRFVKRMVNPSIGFMWYQRPSHIFFRFVNLIRLTGSSNRIPKIEKTYKNNYDVNLIANFEDVLIEYKKTQNLYLR